jgi:hypothetical protein
MATTEIDDATAEQALRILDELIERQRRQVVETARRLRPGLTDADLGRIDEFPEVLRDPFFQAEDGKLAGLVAAKIALGARLAGQEPEAR